MINKLRLLSYALASALAFSGCATFLTTEKQEKATQANNIAQKKSLSIVYSQFQQTDKEMEKAREEDRLITEKRIIKILNETGLFSEIKVVDGNNVATGTDLTIKFNALTKVDNQIGALRILAFVTLGIVPMQFKQETKLTGEVLDKNGKKLKVTEGAFKSDTWIGWFVLPLMPFYSPDSQADKAFKGMIDEALQALQKDNIL